MNKLYFLSLILLLMGSATVYSKCPLADWHISGKVINSKTKMPVQGAQVLFFLDDSESTNAAGYDTKYPDFYFTAADGTFEATSYFDTFKKRTFLKGDVCSKKPKRVEIIVIKSGYKTLRKMFVDSEFEIIENRNVRKIILPDILLSEPMRM